MPFAAKEEAELLARLEASAPLLECARVVFFYFLEWDPR